MSMPAEDYRSIKLQNPKPLLSGLDRSVSRVFGPRQRRTVVGGNWLLQSTDIHKQSLQFHLLSNDGLKDKLKQYEGIYRRQKTDEPPLTEALALIVEAADRTLGMRPYPVQIYAALLIWHGYLAEMATGEGKSLTACLPAILAGWSGKPCHVITANDYLASRDAVELAPLYQFCGLSVGWIDSEMKTRERKQSYTHSVVYVTGKEILADFLRDWLQLGEYQHAARLQLNKVFGSQSRASANTELVMRGIDTAIVDEADSVLIDEAVTPLIIASPRENKAFTEACQAANQISAQLLEVTDFTVNRQNGEIILTALGEEKIAKVPASFPTLFKSNQRTRELVITALTAKTFFINGQQYVVENDKVVIVDEFTGRMMPQRSWRQGLQQAIEIQQGLPVTDPSETLARLSFQRFFRYFRKLGGMTGTARESADEFWDIYQLFVHPVPTNKPCIRKTLPALIFTSQEEKLQAICTEIFACYKSGQPVLVGTRTVAASEELAVLLTEQGIPFRLLNAVRHREEAEIIATAGQRGMVTIATNMAGRGTDIKLGAGVAKLGGLQVIVSEQHESKRIDRQLAGRCARQGEPGTVRVYCSLDDSLLRRYGHKFLLKPMAMSISEKNSKMSSFTAKIVSTIQKSAQQRAYRQRKVVMQTDDWLNESLALTRNKFQK